jgi:alkyl hydroperoxide reductase subunit D
MTLETLGASLPPYARDLKLNLSSLANDTTLSPAQKAGTFIATALAARNETVARTMIDAFGPQLSPEEREAAHAAAAIMGMNNIYYRFIHLAASPDYKTMPAKLRMNVIAKPGAAKADFELWSLAVSAINGCGMCIDSHEKVLREHGVTAEQIQTAVRIASVVHAIAVAQEWQTQASGQSELAA